MSWTTDRLLAHGRQDAAHALGNTISILDQLQAMKRKVDVLFSLVVLLIIATSILLLSVMALDGREACTRSMISQKTLVAQLLRSLLRQQL
jgi:hypothetical protein